MVNPIRGTLSIHKVTTTARALPGYNRACARTCNQGFGTIWHARSYCCKLILLTVASQDRTRRRVLDHNSRFQRLALLPVAIPSYLWKNIVLAVRTVGTRAAGTFATVATLCALVNGGQHLFHVQVLNGDFYFIFMFFFLSRSAGCQTCSSESERGRQNSETRSHSLAINNLNICVCMHAYLYYQTPPKSRAFPPRTDQSPISASWDGFFGDMRMVYSPSIQPASSSPCVPGLELCYTGPAQRLLTAD